VTLGPSDLLPIAVLLGAGTLLALLARVRRPTTLAGYLLADRTLPAWLAGTSIAATGIWSASPLLTTGLLVRPATAGGWLWWSGALGGLLTAAFFARLWRRSAVLTDVELVELRYGGRTAALLRAIRALYAGLALTLLALAWITGLLTTALAPALGWPTETVAGALLGLAALWAVIGGLRGLAVAHTLVLVSLLVAGLLLATASLGALGGVGALHGELAQTGSALGPWTAASRPAFPSRPCSPACWSHGGAPGAWIRSPAAAEPPRSACCPRGMNGPGPPRCCGVSASSSWSAPGPGS
jgi:solute:Na+ symporter, SSS family